MTREQAINYLFSRGFTNEQVGEVVRALTYKPRDCANCKHYVVTDTRTNWGSQETTKIYGCECWECEYEPTTKNNLGVEEVTALAEWTEKLTKASEDAYNKGYEAGRKELEPITSKDKFIYALTACGCLLKDGKTWYEHNELIKCFEDLGLFEQESFINKPCVSSEVCEHDKNKVLDKIRAEIEGLTYYWCETHPKNVIDDVLEIIDKNKAEQE